MQQPLAGKLLYAIALRSPASERPSDLKRIFTEYSLLLLAVLAVAAAALAVAAAPVALTAAVALVPARHNYTSALGTTTPAHRITSSPVGCRGRWP